MKLTAYEVNEHNSYRTRQTDIIQTVMFYNKFFFSPERLMSSVNHILGKIVKALKRKLK